MYPLARLLTWAVAGAAVVTGRIAWGSSKEQVGEQNGALTDKSVDGKADPFLGIQFKSGYIPVGLNSKLFYWYFPRKDAKGNTNVESDMGGGDNDGKPWMIWLTGGPGCSSSSAALMENGPLLIDIDTGTTRLNPYSWNGIGDIVYIDQPVGVGFSIAGDESDYARSEDDVAKHLRQFLIGFLQLFPKFTGRPFFVTGESFAGHYIPSLVALLLREPVKGLNLQGMVIGNPWVHPKIQYASLPGYAADAGMISVDEFDVLHDIMVSCGEMIDHQFYDRAYNVCQTMCYVIRGERNGYDVRRLCDVPGDLCYNVTHIDEFMNSPAVQKRFDVNMRWEECNSTVEHRLDADYVKDVVPAVLEIVNSGLPVVIYSGTQDYMCNTRGTLDWLLRLEWYGKEEFNRTPFHQWTYAGQSRGLLRSYKNLAFLTVDDAGHMVPMDQPEAAFGLLEQFSNGKLAASSVGASTAAVAEDSHNQKPNSQKALHQEPPFMAKQAVVVTG